MKAVYFLLFMSLLGNAYQYRWYHLQVVKGQRFKRDFAQVRSSLAAVKKRPKSGELATLAPKVPRAQGLAGSLEPSQIKANMARGREEDREELAWEDGDEVAFEEVKKQWSEDMQGYILDTLSLSEEDYQSYQRSVEQLQMARSGIHKIFFRKQEEEGLPYIPSFEEEKALLHVQEQILSALGKRFGRDKLQQLMMREQRMKAKMLEERGFYNSFGLF